MTILTVPATWLAYIAIVYLLYIFAMLSRKLGAVTKMKPYYRWLYAALALVLLALACKWIVLAGQALPQATPGFILSEWFYFWGHTVPLVLAAVVALITVLRYWGWLFGEHER